MSVNKGFIKVSVVQSPQGEFINHHLSIFSWNLFRWMSMFILFSTPFAYIELSSSSNPENAWRKGPSTPSDFAAVNVALIFGAFDLQRCCPSTLRWPQRNRLVWIQLKGYARCPPPPLLPAFVVITHYTLWKWWNEAWNDLIPYNGTQ